MTDSLYRKTNLSKPDPMPEDARCPEAGTKGEQLISDVKLTPAKHYPVPEAR